MIKYYQKTVKDHKLKKLEEFQVGSLICVNDPDEKEIKLLADRFKLERGTLLDALDPYETPRMEIKKGKVYIFMRVPDSSGDIKKITTFPILFIIGADFLMIISTGNVSFLITPISKRRRYFTTQRTKLFLQLFLELENVYTNLLTKINKRVNYLSLDIGNMRDQDIINFVNYEIVLNEFVNALVPASHILSNILSNKNISLFQADQELLEDLRLSNEQLIERCKSNLTNIVNIRKAHEVVATNRLNRVMKVLTAATVILALPTMITSFYGMNVRLPLASSPYIFWGISALITVLIIILLLLFKRRRLL